MEIIKPSERGISVSYELNFGMPDKNGVVRLAFGFPCDPNGEVFTPKNQAACDNLARCLQGLGGIVSLSVKRYQHAYNIPAVGRCIQCSREVTLSAFTNTCDCGADYNSCGQLLAPRSQWGEETGENLTDIYNESA